MRNDAVKDGVQPRRGMWLVSPSRKLAYGRINRVLSSGEIEWLNAIGWRTRTSYETIHAGDYIYLPSGPVPKGYIQPNILKPEEQTTMKLKKPNPGNGQCDAMRCKAPPHYYHQWPDGTLAELCEAHSAALAVEQPQAEVFLINHTPTEPTVDLPAPEILEPEALQHVGNMTTDLATLEQATFVAQLAADGREQEEALALVKDFEIKNQDDFTFMEEIVADSKKTHKKYEARRTKFTKPANALLTKFNSWFKPVLLPLKEIENVGKTKLRQFRAAQIQEQQRLVAAARELEEPEAIRETVVAAANAVPESTSSSFIDHWVYTITDVSLLPREFLMPDDKKIAATVAVQKGDTTIPGVEVRNEPIVRSSSK